MRVLIIVARLLPFALSFLRDRRRWLVVGRGAGRTDAFHRRRAEQLVAAIGRLGPTFVKLAQVFAGRADLIPEPYVSTLATLTDRVPAVPLAEIERVIAESYGRTAAELFEQFEPEPIAAASLGQVHRARLNGRDVAVKILRPGVERLVSKDVAAADRILAVLERKFPNPHVRGFRTVVNEFSLRIGDEMDFRKEAANAERIRGNFANNRRVAVPQVFPEMTRQRVLVLEFMNGRRIDALDEWIAAGRIHPPALVSTILELYIQMMLIDGLFHADPHAGNILVTERGTVVLLDFGMVVPVPRDTRWHLISTVFAAVRKDAEGVVAGFYALGLIEPGADRAVIVDLATTLLELAHTRSTATERIELLADEVMATLYDWPVVLPRDMVYFARAAALIEGIGVRYDERFNALEVAAPIALRMRRRILASLRDDGETRPLPIDWAVAVGGALGHVARVVTRAGAEIFALLQAEARGDHRA